eukprot:scaffold19296_cov156-Skeletonema_marinoi.AAC.3
MVYTAFQQIKHTKITKLQRTGGGVGTNDDSFPQIQSTYYEVGLSLGQTISCFYHTFYVLAPRAYSNIPLNTAAKNLC